MSYSDIASSVVLVDWVNEMERQILEYQRKTEERFDRVFGILESYSVAERKIFLDGQIYDAFAILVEIVREATKNIVLIDAYTDMGTLNILAKKHSGVNVFLCTSHNGSRLSRADLRKFNAQYPTLTVRKTNAFHDRFMILDGTHAFHIGMSLKDAGKKCFALTRIEDKDIIDSLLTRIQITCD